MQIQEPLFLAAQAGERAALEQLIVQLRPDVRRYARLQCHRSSAIEDVVQEALIVVWRRVGGVRSPAALAGWLLVIVARLCMLPALMLLKGTVDLGQLSDTRELATRPVDELRVDLVRALESLPPAYREVVILRDMEELTISEIAERLQLTREATKSRLHRARTLVREYLLPDGRGRA